MSIRREIRLRKEFLHRKQTDINEMIKLDKKRKIKSAIDQGKAIPTELRNDARELKHEMENDIETLEERYFLRFYVSILSLPFTLLHFTSPSYLDRTEIDDEYANVGIRDPKVCVTTSRDPGSRLKQFAKEIKICIPNSQAINRGTYRVGDLLDACKKADFTDIVIVNETRGNPDNIVISHLPFGPTASFTISGAVLRHDIPECVGRFFLSLYSFFFFQFTLLYFTLLYSTLLYFTLLYFTLLYFTLLYFTLLYFTLHYLLALLTLLTLLT